MEYQYYVNLLNFQERRIASTLDFSLNCKQETRESVAIDLLSLPRSHQGSTAAIVYVDHYSHFVVLVLLPNKNTSATAHALFSSFLLLHHSFSIE